jgi:hypothetical protein
MTVYLAKFELNGKASYKVGHTKYYYPDKRFKEESYNKFDKITILDQIRISDPSAEVARTKAKIIECCLLAFFPKNFLLEDYYNAQPGFFNKLSGITEMFILSDKTTEENVRHVFFSVKSKLHAASVLT